MPNLLKPNRIMPPIVDVVNPMLAAVVVGKVLQVVEGYPVGTFLPVLATFVRSPCVLIIFVV